MPNATINKAIVDIRLHPRCACNPTSRPIIDSSNACNQTPARVVCRCMDQSNWQLLGVYVCRAHVSPKLSLSLRGLSPPSNTVPQAKPTRRSKRHLDRFSSFCMGAKCYAVQCIVSREETPQNCPFLLGFRHPAIRQPSHGHRQHA